MRASVSTTRCWSAPERGDEHEQHPTGHEGLAAGPGVEGERVGGEHGEGRADRRQQRPAAEVLDRGDGVLELVADEAEVGPRDVPRLARREDGGERPGVGDPCHRPHQRGRGDGDRQQRVDVEPAQQQRRAVPDEHDHDHIGDELPVGEDAGEPEGGDERVGGEGDGGEDVEPVAMVAGLDPGV